MTLIPSYYFTEMDPDYSVKGARDPLGLQVLWQEQAHKIIPYLSTVSNNINDFHILCLAYHLYGKEPDNQFVNYFMRFEQILAYVRCRYNIDANFNGVRKVKRMLFDDDKKRIPISNKPSSAILSNQRAYGIWGKYSRPFGDLKILQHPDFIGVMNAKLAPLLGLPAFEKLCKLLHKNEGFTIDVEELEFLVALFKYEKTDIAFYEQTVMKTRSSHNYQDELLAFIKTKKTNGVFNFYTLLQEFKISPFATDENLQYTLTETEATEKVLAPINRAFRYLLKKPIWNKEELQVDPFITNCKNAPVHLFPDILKENNITKNEMGTALQQDNWTMINYLVKRNKETVKRRGGAPWMTLNGDLLEVNIGESSLFRENFNAATDNDNNYFFDSYLALYRKLYEN